MVAFEIPIYIPVTSLADPRPCLCQRGSPKNVRNTGSSLTTGTSFATEEAYAKTSRCAPVTSGSNSAISSCHFTGYPKSIRLLHAAPSGTKPPPTLIFSGVSPPPGYAYKLSGETKVSALTGPWYPQTSTDEPNPLPALN